VLFDQYQFLYMFDFFELQINQLSRYVFYVSRMFAHHCDSCLNARNPRRDSLGKRDKSRIVFNPFIVLSSLPPPFSTRASGLIVLRRINYHLLSAAAEACTKHEAPQLWHPGNGGTRTAQRDAAWCNDGTMRRPGLRRDAANNGCRETPASRRRA